MYDYIIYTDGAYSSSRDQGGIGIVYTKDGETIYHKYSQMYPKNANSARMELLACAVALQSIKSPSNILIVTDYRNLSEGATGNFQRHSNLNIWAIIDKAMKFHLKVDFEWVKGHEDNPLNQIADKLAVEASQLITLKDDTSRGKDTNSSKSN